MSEQTLRFANFLSPALHTTYEQIIASVAHETGVPMRLEPGTSFEELTQGRLAGGFLCGLIYVHLVRAGAPIELSAAPVLLGERYQQQPRYFSDIIVRADSPFRSFADLAGCTWAYNETASHSGYNLVYHGLLEQGLTPLYFGAWRASGSHARSLQLVLEGAADATALDSHVLAALLCSDASLARSVRTIGSFGPSTIPPIVISTSLSADLRRKIQRALLRLADVPHYARFLKAGHIERFVSVQDEQYNDIRAMYARVQGAEDYS